MVALFSLFEHGEIGFHVRFFEERRAVNSREHLVLLVASPVSAGDRSEFERFDKPRGRKMRTAAKVGEIALLIERNYAILGKLLYKLNFIRFLVFFHKGDGVLS